MDLNYARTSLAIWKYNGSNHLPTYQLQVLIYRPTSESNLMSMVQLPLRFRSRNLAQQLDLRPNVLQDAQDVAVRVYKLHLLVNESLVRLERLSLPHAVRDEGVLGLDPLLDFERRCSEAEARAAREELCGMECQLDVKNTEMRETNVVRSLEVEASVEEVEVLGAVDVHRSAELAVHVTLEEFRVRDHIVCDRD